ncbi:MAG: DUF488 family protein [Planctomycetota bacterium]
MIRAVNVRDHIPRHGKRFLVDRLWPRGIARADLQLDGWCKEAAPTHDLRRWFDHKLERWMEFREEYRAQLAENQASWQPLLEAARAGDVILLFSARDRDYNQAVVLKEFLEEQL